MTLPSIEDGREFVRAILAHHHAPTAMEIFQPHHLTTQHGLWFMLPYCMECRTIVLAGGPAFHYNPVPPDGWDRPREWTE